MKSLENKKKQILMDTKYTAVYPISPELELFMKKPRGSLVSYKEAIEYIYTYIKKNKLETYMFFEPDNTLLNLIYKNSCIYQINLNVKKFDETMSLPWRLFKHKYKIINHHFIKYNYKQMKTNMYNSGLAEEIAKKVFNPERLNKICKIYNIEFEELNDIYSEASPI